MDISPRHAAIVLCLLLPACAPVIAPPPPAPTVGDRQRLAAVHAAAGVDDTELNVQPLRDPQVEDLRAKAASALAADDAAAAAESLNQALLIVPDDPAVLQERAEVALLQSQYERAETLARRAYAVGSKVGPLCRRHWATIEQSLQARGQAENAAAARAQIGLCTVPGVQRM